MRSRDGCFTTPSTSSYQRMNYIREHHVFNNEAKYSMEHSGSRVSAKMGHSRARHCPFWSGEGSFGALTVVVQTNIPLPYRFLDLLLEKARSGRLLWSFKRTFHCRTVS
ncbi:hypothetical protein QE152_g30000 [Popillia japonica]|uniref:Uncharacterized protein n=1 Tax=Popillia japonica TaxID=7064 RepID=A0AAW1JG67_POPJA